MLFIFLIGILLATACTSMPQLGTPTAMATSTGLSTPAGSAAIPNFRHIFIIVMENKDYQDIIGSSKAPYLNTLAHSYAVASRYYGVRHPSLPNYLALISGSTQGMTTDCENCSFDDQNIVDQLAQHQKTWGAYMEDMPNPCFSGTSAGGGVFGVGGYARKHNPFIYFNDISQNPARCKQVVPLTKFAEDLGSNRLPDFVWITPNLIHDMHDGSIQEGDSWLASFVPAILASPAWKDNGVVFITWDEGTSDAGCCGNAEGGRVATLVIAPHGKRGYRSEVPYSHYSLLRTIEDAWHLGYLGHAADPETRSLADFWQ